MRGSRRCLNAGGARTSDRAQMLPRRWELVRAQTNISANRYGYISARQHAATSSARSGHAGDKCIGQRASNGALSVSGVAYPSRRKKRHPQGCAGSSSGALQAASLRLDICGGTDQQLQSVPAAIDGVPAVSRGCGKTRRDVSRALAAAGARRVGQKEQQAGAMS